MATDSREVLLTVHAQVRPDGRLCGTVCHARSGAGAGQGAAPHGFEGWLELLATLTRLLGVPPGPTGRSPTGRGAGSAAPVLAGQQCRLGTIGDLQLGEEGRNVVGDSLGADAQA